MWPCGVIVLIAELFHSESCSQVYGYLHELLRRNSSTLSRVNFTCAFFTTYISEYLCYDDGCHLRRYATNPVRRDLTVWTKQIANLEIVIDKLHFAGHVDKWCQEVCDPCKHRELDKVFYVIGAYLQC